MVALLLTLRFIFTMYKISDHDISFYTTGLMEPALARALGGYGIGAREVVAGREEEKITNAAYELSWHGQ